MRKLLCIFSCGFALVSFALGISGASANAEADAGRVSGQAIVKLIKAKLPELLADKKGFFAGLQQQGILELRDERPVVHIASSLPAPPDASLKHAINLILKPPPDFLVWLPKVKFGGAYDVAGADDCEGWLMFNLLDGQTHFVKPPSFLDQGICSLDGIGVRLGVIKHQPAVIMAGDWGYAGKSWSTLNLKIDVGTWLGSRWSKSSLNVLYSFPPVDPALAKGYCLPDLCAAAKKLAVETVRSLSQNRKIEVPDPPLSSAEEGEFKSVEYPSPPGCEYESVPKNLARLTGNETNGVFGLGDNGFAPDSVLFATRLNGKFVLGCVGHIFYPPHAIGHAWLVRFSKLQGDSWQPIAFLEIPPNHAAVHVISAHIHQRS